MRPRQRAPGQANTEFGEGEFEVGMNMFVYAQVGIVFPPFSDRRFLRDANGAPKGMLRKNTKGAKCHWQLHSRFCLRR